MARKKTTVAQKLSKITFDLEKVRELAGLGLTDVEIGLILGVTEQTVNNWKKDDAFLLALKEGKSKSDTEVTKSLYKRATGFTMPDTYFSSYQGVVTATPYTKHYAPDTIAQIFWLKNRRPDLWRDKQDVDMTSGGQAFEFIIGAAGGRKNKDSDS